jgi:hypothetical protein
LQGKIPGYNLDQPSNGWGRQKLGQTGDFVYKARRHSAAGRHYSGRRGGGKVDEKRRFGNLGEFFIRL